MAKSKEEIQAKKDAYNARRRERYAKGDPVRAAQNKRWKDANPEKIKESNRRLNLRKNYMLTIAQYDALFKKQRGRCACCGKPETKVLWGSVIKLAVDHTESRGRIIVRGLVCACCNMGLGHLGDTTKSLKRAFEYTKNKIFINGKEQ